jgi:DNA-binding MarR family transcriptional regulator
MPYILRGIQLEFFVRQGVTQTQFLVLGSIRASLHCSMGTLARSLHVSLPTVSGIVDRLVRAGYVQRTMRPEDRRQVIVELTAKGQKFFRNFEAVIRRRWEEALLPLGPSELKAFYTTLTKLREHLQTTPR